MNENHTHTRIRMLLRILLLVLIVVLVASGVPALELPPTPAGKTLGEWLAMTNAGKQELATRFVGERFTPEFLRKLPIDAMAAFHVQLHERAGTLTPQRLLESDDHRIRLLAIGAGGNEGGEAGGEADGTEDEGGEPSRLWEVTLTVQEEAPHGISQLRVVPAPEPPATEPPVPESATEPTPAADAKPDGPH
jgi:hypothetical protein